MKFVLFILLVFNSILMCQEFPEIFGAPVLPIFYPQEATNANVPEPKNILVVYNTNDTTSINVMNHYKSKRNIPSENIIGLDLPDTVIVNAYGGFVALTHNNERIYNHEGWDQYGWHYYKNYIADPIETYLLTTYNTDNELFKDAIRYIILCKGIPFKIHEYGGYGIWFTRNRIHIAVDALLGLICQDNDFDIFDLYQTRYDHSFDYYHPELPMLYENPYYGDNTDINFEQNHRFLSQHYYTIFEGDTLKLNYLVSRIDGKNQNKVFEIIDKFYDLDYSGNNYFVIDADRRKSVNRTADDYHMRPAYNKLSNLGFNVNYDFGDLDWIVDMPNNEKVIAYTSMGKHADMPQGYINDILNFNYQNGAIFDTYESYNFWSMNPDSMWGYTPGAPPHTTGQGLITHFLNTGGTGGSGNQGEPYVHGICGPEYFFPAYAMGYSVVDAAYMGIRYLAWQNVVIGDPLSYIAWGKQTLLENTTWDGTNLVTGEITVPQGKTLTVNSGAVINFKHFGSLKVEGNLVINQGANMFFYNDSSLTVHLGTVTANGIPSNKIIFDFVAPNGNTSNGIKMKGGTLTLTNCVIKNAYNGIDAVKGDDLFVEKTSFENIENTGVSVTRFTNLTPWIKECSFEDLQYGVIAAGGDEAVIKNCSFHNAKLSVYASQIAAAAAIGNSIMADSTFNEADPDGYGIYYNSSGGIISKNQIGGHYYGVYLANSSPYVGANNIVTSAATGIYASSGSMPDLSETIITSHECQTDYVYPVSGFNTIDQNGNLDSLNGAEIYLYSASVDLQNGRNTISDERGGAANNILIDGTQNPWPGAFLISAENNYWGASVSSSRFGSELTVDFQPYLSAPVPVPQSGNCPYIIYDKEGTAVDTVYPYVERSGLSGSAKSYAVAGGNFLKGEYEAAKSLYNSIISGETPNMKDYKAYERLYVIEKLMKSAPEAFEALAGFYAEKRAESSDEMLNDFLEQLERLCTVSAEEYAGAIAEFTSVAEANPGTETAVNAEVDALTTALIAANSGLGKITAGKYAVCGLSDYARKLNGLLNINKNSLNTEDDEIETPKKFVLRQNYPNPYNPTTTIKYEIPENSFVELKVFDILEREVAVLANGVKEAGRYEVTFNANSLSSGVYIYRLKTANKIISKKMILLR